MGIPFYFRYLLSNHREAVLGRHVQGRYDYLCIDFNCLIHKCAQTVAQQCAHRDTDALHEAIFACIVAYTDRLIELVRPRRGTYLAVDGVPPLAKIQQQRKRRYMSVYEKRYTGSHSLWNSNVVTPGTEFMTKLSRILAEGMEGLTVLSDWTEPGEGEHKIFRFLAGIEGPKPSAIIYGLDADMIMLSLMHPEHEIVLLREKECVILSKPLPQHFNVVDIAQLRTAVRARMGANDDACVQDYIALCMLVGNDFVPPLSYLQILRDDIDVLLDAYRAGRTTCGGNLVDFAVCPPALNYRLLTQIVQSLAVDEDRAMQAATDEYYTRPVPPGRQWKHYPLMYKFPRGLINPTHKGWRMQYYAHLFGPHADPSAIVSSYLEGLEWNLQYYARNEAPEEQWFYPFTYSPTIKDLHNFLVAKKGPDPDWRARYTMSPITLTPLVQLLAVIPPEDKLLLPERYRELSTDLRHGCVQYYPVTFGILTFLKTFAWETVPVLPNVDIGDIADATGVLSVP